MIKAFHYADYTITPRPKSRYPLRKFHLLREFSQKLGFLQPHAIESGPPAQDEDILQAHSKQYLNQVKQGPLDEQHSREMGFLWTEELWERASRIVGSSLSAYNVTISGNHGFTLGGGAHHAGRSRGRGFCVFNDIAVVAFHHLKRNGGDCVAILDCDVHQGDGTAEITRDRNDIFTISLHGEKNYPFRKQESDLDIALPDECRDALYLQELDSALNALRSLSRVNLLIYIAGADPFQEDRLGRLNITAAGLLERDLRVYQWCKAYSVPVVTFFGGGYCEPIEKTVLLNLQTIAACSHVNEGNPLRAADIPSTTPVDLLDGAPIPEVSP